ncbi:MAG: alpha/beta hydrolase family protein [Rhodothermales bacterium]
MRTVALIGLLIAATACNHPAPPDRVAPAEWADVVGWYELPGGTFALLTWAADGGLRFISFAPDPFSDRVAITGPDRLHWFRGDATNPLVLRVERDEDAIVAGLAWVEDTENKQRAPRRRDYGYDVRELTFDNGEITLSASLFLPDTLRQHPAAVMIHGSGESDRDNLWYMRIAHELVTHGIAVLLPDKRGSGKSGGDWTTAAFSDFAGDALAGVAAVQGEKGIDGSRVGLLGISQGGWIAPLAASMTQDLTFVINVSGATVTPNEQLAHELGGSAVRVFFAKARKRIWWNLNGDFDPVPYWRRLTVPGLIVFGDQDEHENVPVTRSVARLDSILVQSEGPPLTVRVLEGTGHGMFEAGTRRIRADFLDLLVTWIREKTGISPVRYPEV